MKLFRIIPLDQKKHSVFHIPFMYISTFIIEVINILQYTVCYITCHAYSLNQCPAENSLKCVNVRHYSALKTYLLNKSSKVHLNAALRFSASDLKLTFKIQSIDGNMEIRSFYHWLGHCRGRVRV